MVREVSLIRKILAEKGSTECHAMRKILRDFALSALIRAIEANTIESIKSWTKGAKLELRQDPEITWTAAHISRDWILDLAQGVVESEDAPQAWTMWRDSGKYAALTSEPTTIIRSVEEQSPQNSQQAEIVGTISEHLRPHPPSFEGFAAKNIPDA